MQKVSTCPVCNGNKRQVYQGPHASIIAGFDPVDYTIPCQNCGGQYMFGTPLGVVKHNAEDKPCRHEYVVAQAGKSLQTYTCKHCNDTYQIDSGD